MVRASRVLDHRSMPYEGPYKLRWSAMNITDQASKQQFFFIRNRINNTSIVSSQQPSTTTMKFILFLLGFLATAHAAVIHPNDIEVRRVEHIDMNLDELEELDFDTMFNRLILARKSNIV